MIPSYKTTILITGKMGIGKTTLIKKVIDEFKINLIGFFTYYKFKGSLKQYFFHDLITKTIIKIGEKEKNSDLSVDISVFDGFCSDALDRVLNSKENVVVMDELGRFEENSESFKSRIFDLIKKKKVLGVIKEYDSPFLNEIRELKNVEVININEDNRDALLKELLDFIKQNWKLRER